MWRLVRLWFFILVFFEGALLARAEANLPDTTFLHGKIGGPIKMICGDDNNGFYVVSGQQANKLHYINQKQKVNSLPGINRTLQKTSITTLCQFDKKLILIGTNGQYLYCIRNNRLLQFDYRYGLTDSVITAIKLDSISNQVIIVGAKKQFLLDYMASRDQFNIKEVNPANSVQPPAESIVSRYFRKPLQKAICDIFGDVDFSFRKRKTISSAHVNQIKRALLPGDILVKRNDLQLSNVAIPGYWTHTAIYLGSLKEWDAIFSDLPILQGKRPSEYVKLNYYKAYKRMSHRQNIIIEAVAEGVVINPVENIARVDYFAAMRPEIDKSALFESLIKSLSYFGRPYDYLFDIENDNELICSELVYRSFGGNQFSLKFKMSQRDGAAFLSPTDIAKQCIQEQHNKPPLLRLVVYCGLDAQTQKSTFKSFDDFAEVSNL